MLRRVGVDPASASAPFGYAGGGYGAGDLLLDCKRHSSGNTAVGAGLLPFHQLLETVVAGWPGGYFSRRWNPACSKWWSVVSAVLSASRLITAKLEQSTRLNSLSGRLKSSCQLS
jgi:hypothetical protein